MLHTFKLTNVFRLKSQSLSQEDKELLWTHVYDVHYDIKVGIGKEKKLNKTNLPSITSEISCKQKRRDVSETQISNLQYTRVPIAARDTFN